MRDINKLILLRLFLSAINKQYYGNQRRKKHKVNCGVNQKPFANIKQILKKQKLTQWEKSTSNYYCYDTKNNRIGQSSKNLEYKNNKF